MAHPQKKQEILSHEPSPKLRLYRNDSVEFEDAPPLLEELAPLGVSLGDFLYPDVVSRQACFWGGLVFSIIGAIEFFFPQAAGAFPSRFHSFFYLGAGAALFLPALSLPPKALRRVSVVLGVFLATIGFLGFLMGAPEAGDRFQWALFPGNLEFGTKDHVLQEIIGVTLVLVGLHSRKKNKREFLEMSIR